LILSICIGGKELGFEGSVTFWYFLLVAVKNPRNSNEEEEEIEIPKSRNSSRTLKTWAAAARRRRRSKFPNQEIPQEH
jgi:hypothetical protein